MYNTHFYFAQNRKVITLIAVKERGKESSIHEISLMLYEGDLAQEKLNEVKSMNPTAVTVASVKKELGSHPGFAELLKTITT